jgi:glutathione S-transferase
VKVYGHPISTCTRKVLTTLAEKGHAHEFGLVDLFKGQQKSPEHLARHPFGVVPVLEDDGYSLYESRAIIRYLDAKLPGVSLTPKDLHERGRMEQLISVEQSYFSPQAMKIVSQLLFNKMQGKEPDMAVVSAAKGEVSKVLDVTEKHLAGKEFLAGGSFSLADIDWMPYVQYVVQAGEGALITDRPNVGAWWKRVSSRPTWQKVVG